MRASLGSLAASDGLDEEQSDELAAEAPFSSIQQNELKTMLAANNQELLDAMRAMLKSNDASESAEATIPAGGRPVGGDKTGPSAKKRNEDTKQRLVVTAYRTIEGYN